MRDYYVPGSVNSLYELYCFIPTWTLWWSSVGTAIIPSLQMRKWRPKKTDLNDFGQRFLKKKSLVNARKGTSIYKIKGWEENQRWGTDGVRIRSGLGKVETRAVGQSRGSLAQCRKLLDIIYYLPLWPILGKGTLRSCSMTLETMENNHSLPLRRRVAISIFNPGGDQGWWGRVYHGSSFSLFTVSMTVPYQYPPMSRINYSVPWDWAQSCYLLQPP